MILELLQILYVYQLQLFVDAKLIVPYHLLLILETTIVYVMCEEGVTLLLYDVKY